MTNIDKYDRPENFFHNSKFKKIQEQKNSEIATYVIQHV